MSIKDEVEFFQAIKTRLEKFNVGANLYGCPDNGRPDETLEITIKQIIDKALVSEQVIDIRCRRY